MTGREALCMLVAAVIAVGLAVSPPIHPGVPACATEDSAGPCCWDASARGNGEGRSFTVGSDQVVTYLTK